MEKIASEKRTVQKALLVALLAFAALLRIWALPSRNEIRDTDELGYVSSGLVMWEGMMPTERAVPAGEQTWSGWFYIAARSAWELIHLHATPTELMPFKAIDQALFKTYEDLGGLRSLLLWISIGIALAGVYGGYRLGLRYGGIAGGLLIGGLVAALPLYVEFAGISKSCSDAWMFGIAALGSAATLQGAKRLWVSSLLLGLAIASRIDMVLLGPLALWLLWDNPDSDRFWISAIKFAACSGAITVLAAPWAVSGIVGMLRAIVMTRVVGYWATESPRLDALKGLMWRQGLAPVLLVTAVGLVLCPRETRLKRWILAAFTALMVATMFGKNYQPIRYQGGPIIALLTVAGVVGGTLLQRIPKVAAAILAVLLLALPFAQSLRTVKEWKSFYVPEDAANWVERHVSPGTIVYLQCTFTVKALLPTEAAADACWHLVAGDQSWRTKIEDGLKRFSLPREELPRAMSDDNLVMDRGFCRRWFILGGGKSQRPRYDVRVLSLSRTFGWHTEHLAEDFKRTGGVVIWRTVTGWKPPEGLGEPRVKWVNDKGYGTFLYVSPDAAQKLKEN